MATMTEPKAENKTLVHFMVEGGVAIIELDDAPANTYTYEMMRQLDEAILRARFDDDVHVVVLRGHGDKFFSAGANIGMLNSVTPRFKFFFCLHANETLNRLEQTPKLTIAALNGHTEGGGPDQAVRADGRRDSVRVGAGPGARIAAAAVPERGRKGRHRRERREAGRGVQGPVKTDLLIGNEWRSTAKRYRLTNPATEEQLAEVAEAGEVEIDAAVRTARACLDSKEWRELPARKRGQLLYCIAELLEQRSPEIAELETKNNGKPLFESKIDVAMAVETFRYYAGWADKLTGDTLPVSGNFFTYTLREPVGVVGAIVPWNFPLNLASWKVAPALAAGCTVVLKPAHETPLTALLLGEIAVAAGLPPGALNVVPGPGATAGAALVRHRLVDKIAFTGSTEVGQWIMGEAVGAVKSLSVEVGGKRANIVCNGLVV